MRLAAVLALVAWSGCRPVAPIAPADPHSPERAEAPRPTAAPRPRSATPSSIDPTGPSALSGSWSGTYLYTTRDPGIPPGGPASVAFFAELQLESTRLRGSVVEPNTFVEDANDPLRATLVGVIEADGLVRFTKQYDGTAGVTQVVECVGRLDLAAASIEGTWSSPAASGRFVMRRDRPMPQVAERTGRNTPA